jgi:hypothetical protein
MYMDEVKPNWFEELDKGNPHNDRRLIEANDRSNLRRRSTDKPVPVIEEDDQNDVNCG